MPKKSRPTFKKRQKEMARKQRKQDKMARRMERKQERQQSDGTGFTGEDPDIAGIRPGPQPLPEDY